VPPELVEARADRGVGLHERPLQLRGELLAVQIGQQRLHLGGGVPRLEVDDVELLLDADQQLAVTHGRDGR
jgi:hypothetical protein